MFTSIQGQVVIVLGIISIFISVMKKVNYQHILIQLILFLLIARDTDCMINNNCYIRSWTIILVPIAGTLYFTLKHFKLLPEINNTVTNMVKGTVEKINKIDNNDEIMK